MLFSNFYLTVTYQKLEKRIGLDKTLNDSLKYARRLIQEAGQQIASKSIIRVAQVVVCFTLTPKLSITQMNHLDVRGRY
jgi:hypothetical protein